VDYPFAKRQVAVILILLPVYAAFLETLQIFVPGRSAAVTDAFASTVGSWIGIAFVLLLQYCMRCVVDRATSSAVNATRVQPNDR